MGEIKQQRQNVGTDLWCALATTSPRKEKDCRDATPAILLMLLCYVAIN